MLNRFIIAGLVFCGLGLLEEASESDTKKPKVIAGPPGKDGKTGAAGAAGEDGKVVEKPAKKKVEKPAASDG